MHTAAVTRDALVNPNVDDLLQWSGNPYAFAASYAQAATATMFELNAGTQ